VHPTTVFVGGLAKLGGDWGEERLKQLFEAKCGPVKHVRRPTDKNTGAVKG
jgi:hypothetical protein